MGEFSLYDLIVSVIVSSHSVTLGIIALARIKNISDKRETLLFVILAFASAFWSLSSLVNPFYRAYGYITAVVLLNITVIYVVFVTHPKLLKFLLPLSLISTVFIFTNIALGLELQADFTLKFSIAVYPLFVSMNLLLYIYFIKHKTKFHLFLALMATVMILGGLYETLRTTLSLPSVQATTFGTAGFIGIIGYQVLSRGYLSNQGWKDYAKELETKEQLLEEKFLNLKKMNLDAIIVLSQTIEAKDPYTRGHCLRVRNIAKALGSLYDFDKDHLRLLEIGALLHDIGKIGIPGSILNKNGRLTDEEFNEIKKHPEIGSSILMNVGFFLPIIPMILHHHEHYNGKGYPFGLVGEKIPLEARILAVADIYDAISSDRPYREAMPLEKALGIINDAKGVQLDPQIVDLFMDKRIYEQEHDNLEQLKLSF
jgi:putative nucleotidyltransferase with HDIG domain